MQTFSPENEAIMRRYYESLNEKDRRRYAGIEALKLGHGGQNYIAEVLGCSRRTVRKGAIEVSGLPSRAVKEQIGTYPAKSHRIRNEGGGRKQYWISHPEIEEQFLSVLRDHTAGDPMDEKALWTNLREWEIVEALQKGLWSQSEPERRQTTAQKEWLSTPQSSETQTYEKKRP